MKTKTILTMAIIAAFPFGAMAENISGAMYTAPARADTNHPAPTTNAGAPYGRANIDTADQEHIATTAYVKGAYNSAIAAVNNVANNRQEQLFNTDTGDFIIPSVMSASEFEEVISDSEYRNGSGETQLVSVGAMIKTVQGINNDINDLTNDISDVQDTISALQGDIQTLSNKRVEIYTTWDDDTAKQQVAFVNAPAQQ